MGKYSFSDNQDQRREARRLQPKQRQPLPRPCKPLPRQSAKRQREQVIYRQIVADKIKNDPRCTIKSPVCTGIAQGGDHTQKRSPSNFINPDNIKPACNACNLYKELNVQWSIDNGHSISRHAVNPFNK